MNRKITLRQSRAVKRYIIDRWGVGTLKLMQKKVNKLAKSEREFAIGVIVKLVEDEYTYGEIGLALGKTRQAVNLLYLRHKNLTDKKK